MRNFTELSRIKSFEERFAYLRLDGMVGQETFGFDRYLNQRFYTSTQWKQVRSLVIARDNGCDMAFPGYEINGRILIHHMNPMVVQDIVHGNDQILDPEFLISVSHRTHNAIHYGDQDLLPKNPVERAPGDTKLW